MHPSLINGSRAPRIVAGSRAGAGAKQVSRGYLAVPESKGVLREWWGMLKTHGAMLDGLLWSDVGRFGVVVVWCGGSSGDDSKGLPPTE